MAKQSENIAHSKIVGVSASQHHSNANDHAQAHIATSHSDQGATGAELEALTNGSETSLHSHAAESLLASKIITAARSNLPSGDVAYTGVGFQPVSIVALGIVSSYSIGVGFADINLTENSLLLYKNSGSFMISNEIVLLVLHAYNLASNYQKASLKSLDADGFTLTWTKSGSGTSGTIVCLCLR